MLFLLLIHIDSVVDSVLLIVLNYLLFSFSLSLLFTFSLSFYFLFLLVSYFSSFSC